MILLLKPQLECEGNKYTRGIMSSGSPSRDRREVLPPLREVSYAASLARIPLC